MAESKVESGCSTRPDCASSPPPNCSICLGPFSNQCVSDSCRHMFCFKCLLEWSRIKAECPLCKIPFKSIIHNVRSDSDFDQHMVQTQTIPNEIIHHLPTSSARHQFHFRTTFTVDTHGEHAIQQMLLTHPLTNGGQISFSGYSPRRFIRRRRDSSATTFRRSIYNNNLWVSAMPDVTGTYRDVSPSFFRNYPGARTRLAPWLNRELNALLYENTPLIMHLVDQIMDYLLRHHICSRIFRTFLSEYLGQKTDHFVHEFYNFMRSPFDMIGYDRHIVYTERPRSPAPFIDVESDSDSSDVILVDVQQPPAPDGNVVIDLLDSDSDNSVLLSTSTWPMPMPVIQPMVISSDDEEERAAAAPEPSVSTSANNNNNNAENNDQIEQSENQSGPMLPLKLRLKHKRLSKQKLKRRRHFLSSSSSSTSSTSSSTSSSESETSEDSGNDRRKKRKRLLKRRRHGKYNKVCVISSSDSNNSDSDNSDLEENLPLSLVLNKSNKKMKHKKKKRHSHKKSKSKNRDKERKKMKLHHPDCEHENCLLTEPPKSEPLPDSSPRVSFYDSIFQDLPSCSYSNPCADVPTMAGIDLSLAKLKRDLEGSSSDEDSGYDRKPLVKSEVHDVRHLHNNSANAFTSTPNRDEQSLSSAIDVVLKDVVDRICPASYYRQK